MTGTGENTAILGRLLTGIGEAMAGRDCAVSAVLSAEAGESWAQIRIVGPDGDTMAVLDALPDTEWGPVEQYATVGGTRATRRTARHADVQITAVPTEGAR